MKISDIKNLTTEELIAKEQELKTELFNLRFSHATGNLTNPMQLHNLKKDIARQGRRIETIVNKHKNKENNDGTKEG